MKSKIKNGRFVVCVDHIQSAAKAAATDNREESWSWRSFGLRA
jgi:hypothetical protein